jgi:hypothetical protein
MECAGRAKRRRRFEYREAGYQHKSKAVSPLRSTTALQMRPIMCRLVTRDE